MTSIRMVNLQVMKSRLIILSLLASVVFVGGAFALKYNSEKDLSGEISSGSTIFSAEKDEDKDGLKDWEEALWGTSDTDTDSDDNGTGDFEEVEKKRLASSSPETINKGESEGYLDPKNTTEAFSREFFSQIIALKQAGKLTEENITRSTEDLMKRLSISGGTGKIYTSADLTIYPNTAQEIKTYANNIGALALSFKDRKEEHELSILARALSTKSETEIQKLNTLVPLYTSTVNTLAKMPVPRDLVDTHLALINYYQTIVIALPGLTKMFSDNIVGLGALTLYRSQVGRDTQALQALREYLVAKQIVFSKSDAGSIIVGK